MQLSKAFSVNRLLKRPPHFLLLSPRLFSSLPQSKFFSKSATTKLSGSLLLSTQAPPPASLATSDSLPSTSSADLRLGYDLFKKEFLSFYMRAWEAGIRAQDLQNWAPLVVDELSQGRIEYIILNGCYGGRVYTKELTQLIKEVKNEVKQGLVAFDEDDVNGAQVEAAIRLGRIVDQKARATEEDKSKVPDSCFINHAGMHSSQDTPSCRFWTAEEWEDGRGNRGVRVDEEGRLVYFEQDMSKERAEKEILLRLGLQDGSGRYSRLYYAVLPLRAEWHIGEYDGIENVVRL